MKEKAYKLLSKQENISNRAAKELIDRGLVYVGGKKITVARGEVDAKTRFKIQKIQKPKIIFEDKNIIAVDKPAFLTSEEVSKKLGYPLLNRLDKESSGVLLLVKDEEFQKKAIKEYKDKKVIKEYIAWVEGRVVEPIEINKPILTIKGKKAYSKISTDGKEAVTLVEPLIVEGKRSKIKATIKTGRTHQIRVHLKSIGSPIVGDVKYGGKPYNRIMLHSYRTKLFDYDFKAEEPKEFIKNL